MPCDHDLGELQEILEDNDYFVLTPKEIAELNFEEIAELVREYRETMRRPPAPGRH